MEEIEKVKVELAEHEDHITTEREQVASEVAEVEAARDEAQKKVESSRNEREQLQAGLPEGIVAKIEQLERSRQGIFLANADGGTCQSCYVRIRPQVFQEIKVASKVHRCSSCGRFLYNAPSLVIEPVADSTDNVEALNGGAV